MIRSYSSHTTSLKLQLQEATSRHAICNVWRVSEWWILSDCRHWYLSLGSSLLVLVPDTMAASLRTLWKTTTLCLQPLQTAEKARAQSRDFSRLVQFSKEFHIEGVFPVLNQSGCYFYLDLLKFLLPALAFKYFLDRRRRQRLRDTTALTLPDPGKCLMSP